MVTDISCGCLQLHAETNAELQLQFKELRERLKEVTTETASFTLPTGDRTFMKVTESQWDGSFSTTRGARECHHTVYACIVGEWFPIAQHILQSYCAKCQTTVVNFLKKATAEELQQISGGPIAVFRLLAKLQQLGCKVLVQLHTNAPSTPNRQLHEFD